MSEVKDGSKPEKENQEKLYKFTLDSRDGYIYDGVPDENAHAPSGSIPGGFKLKVSVSSEDFKKPYVEVRIDEIKDNEGEDVESLNIGYEGLTVRPKDFIVVRGGVFREKLAEKRDKEQAPQEKSQIEISRAK